MTTPPVNHARARFGALLRELRDSQHLTQLALGRHVRVSPDAVAMWEKGLRLPDEDTAQRLDARLQADGRLLQAWRAADTRTDKPTPADTTLSADSLLATSAQDAAAFGTWAETANTGAVAITTMTNQVRTLADLALTRPPAEIIAEVAAINHALFAVLRGHHKPGHAQGLYAAAGAGCAVLCWLSGDLGNLDAARIHGATAQTCAEMAESPELSAWAAAVQSKTAFWAKDYLKAANLARAGAMHDAPGTAGVMLAYQQADAWARLGAVTETVAALDRAKRAADTMHGTDSLGGLFSCNPGRAFNYAAGSNNEINRHLHAQANADAALAVFAADSNYGFGTVAQTHLTKVLAYVNAGDLDAAAAAARPVLDLAPERRLSTLADRLRPLARALAAPSFATSRVAGPLREEITAFCQNGGQQALTASTGNGAP